VNNKRVELLRDSGNSVSIVRSALVAPEQHTGKQVTCLLVDNCVKNCPQAVVEVDTRDVNGTRFSRVPKNFSFPGKKFLKGRISGNYAQSIATKFREAERYQQCVSQCKAARRRAASSKRHSFTIMAGVSVLM